MAAGASLQPLQLQRDVTQIDVPDDVTELILSVVEGTRSDTRLTLGASPRASMALYKGSQALAAVRGRSTATADDVRELAPAVLMQRITVKPEHLVKGVDQESIIEGILSSLAEPAQAHAG